LPAGALTTIKGVNKVDVVTLGSTFGSLAALMTATSEQLAACPGIGPTKVRRLHDTFHAPFRRTGPRQLRLQPAPAGAGPGAGAQAGGVAAPALVPPPLALQPLAPEDGAAAGAAEEGGAEEGWAEEDGAEELAGEDAAGGDGGGDPTDVAFYASLAPEASDDDQRD
jgi:NAD-dependent DNA ligase